MSAKIFFLLLTICGLCFDVRSQEAMTSGKAKNTNDAKIISADEAAKNALNVGSKMPSFNLKD